MSAVTTFKLADKLTDAQFDALKTKVGASLSRDLPERNDAERGSGGRGGGRK